MAGQPWLKRPCPLATGHYARIHHENRRIMLKHAADPKKDQSYFLWQLKQEDLARTLLPLGGYTKEAIRDMVFKLGFKQLAKKRESYDVCFIADNAYRKFIRKYALQGNASVKPGPFVFEDASYAGRHKGYPFYTVGQRKGLQVDYKKF